MKKSILMLLAACLILGASTTHAQSYYQKEGSLYAEIFGNGGEISANFEKFLGRTASIKVGAGGAWVDFDDNGTDRVIYDLQEDQVVANGVIGFRFIGDYGFNYRLAFTPVYTKDGFQPMGGAIFGYAF